MSTPRMSREVFLSRYATTRDTCSCPDYVYWGRYQTGFCKHIKVARGMISYTDKLVPGYKHIPEWKKQNFASYLAYNSACNHNIKSKLRKKYPNQKITAEMVWAIVFPRAPYKTTKTSCTCPARKYHPNVICKHMKKEINADPNFTLLSEMERMMKEMNEYKAEKDKYDEKRKKVNICKICENNKGINVKCCNYFMCTDCWNQNELKDAECKFCKRGLEPLVCILIDKFKTFNK